MKRICTSTLLIAFTLTSFAQSNFYKLSVGAGAGITQSITEVRPWGYGFAAYGTFDYLFTPFMSLGFEVQKGEINGGDYYTEQQNRQFTNSYKTLSINGKIGLGQIMENNYSPFYNTFKGLYIGGGVGAIQNKMKYIVRYNKNGTRIPGFNASRDVFFPLNLGINFHFTDGMGFYRYALNVNYQGNITLREGLDGYDNSLITFRGGTPDIYTYLSVGLKYSFGPLGLTSKNLR